MDYACGLTSFRDMVSKVFLGGLVRLSSRAVRFQRLGVRYGEQDGLHISQRTCQEEMMVRDKSERQVRGVQVG